MSISVKLVRELRRMKWSRALKAPLPLAVFLPTSGSFPLFDVVVVARERSDLERILDCTKVLKVLKPVPPEWWLWGLLFSGQPQDFLREGDAVDILEVRLTHGWLSDDKSLPSFFWSPKPPLQVVTSILGIGRELLRLRGGGSAVKPHVMPFNLQRGGQISLLE